MKTSIVSLGVYNHTGGPTKTIRDFRRALGADLYSFCQKATLKKHELAIEGANVVVSSSLPLLSQFCYTRGGTKGAEASIRESCMVSCHSFYRYHALWTLKICSTYKVPYSFVPHGILDPWVMQKNRRIKHLYLGLGGQSFIENASVLIFSTQAEKAKAKVQFNLPQSEVIPWAVETVDITDRDKKRIQVRKRLGIPEETHVLIYFGRLHSMKRPLEIIEAFAKASGIATHLIIVGNESDVTKADCMQSARKHGVEKRVHCVGAIYGEAKYDYIHASDAYISFSYRENFNYTATESLAAGLPVILSPGNDLRSELSDFKCCLNIKDNSIESAVKAIETFNDLKISKLHQMGMRGRKWVEENLNFDLFKMRLLELHSKYAKK